MPAAFSSLVIEGKLKAVVVLVTDPREAVYWRHEKRTALVLRSLTGLIGLRIFKFGLPQKGNPNLKSVTRSGVRVCSSGTR